MVLVSTEKTYRAHRAVVCLQSPVISKDCVSNTINTNWIKPNNFGVSYATTISFTFGSDDSRSVDCIIQYFYLSDYDIPRSIPATGDKPVVVAKDDPSNSATGDTTSDDSCLVTHVKVFALAGKYDVPHLRMLSLNKFEAAARLHWKSKYLVEAAREAYTSTVSDMQDMRTAVVKIIYTQQELMDEKHIQDLLMGVPRISYDLNMYFHSMVTPYSRPLLFR